ncbi:MAG TPA: zinc ribbon domain-containing protein [Thermoanaerobaculia bacterium]|nr:zinc ribbon domain-containing protein [Thermoanaerobaculia bacterium]
MQSLVVSFGTEILCDYCRTRSLLIIDNNLVTCASLEASDGRICTQCGRVARGDARFCQCGTSLVRTCYWCAREIPVDHRRCDACGWLDPGFGVLPIVEGRWRTFLALLPHWAGVTTASKTRGNFLDLFRSVWNDAGAGHHYQQRYEEILQQWKYHYPWKYESYISEKIFAARHLFEEIFARVGAPLVAACVRMALQDKERSVSMVALMRDLADGYGKEGVFRCGLKDVARDADAGAEVKAKAMEALGEVYAVHELVELASGKDRKTALMVMPILEKVALGCSDYKIEIVKPLRHCDDREIAARAKKLLKAIERGR